MRQPIQVTNGCDSRVIVGGAPHDEYEDRESPCEHANLPAAEQEEGWYAREDTSQPYEDPGRMGTNETWGVSR